MTENYFKYKQQKHKAENKISKSLFTSSYQNWGLKKDIYTSCIMFPVEKGECMVYVPSSR